MLSIRQLMKHLRSDHAISIKSSQTQALRNIGYYHGYKGYRFIRNPNEKISFSSLDQIIALNEFDMKLKTLFYPKVMFIENALKNYVIESVLLESKSEYLENVFSTSITGYRSFDTGSESYQKQFTKRMLLKSKINNALIRDYKNRKQIVNHFFDSDRPIPIWAVFESLTLGEFGTFFSCSNQNVKLYTSKLMHLPKNYDSDGKIIEFFIYAIKDLRNAIAHNNTIFDTRFQTSKINQRLIRLLESEIGISNLNFQYIDAYVILITYILRKMGETKNSCKKFVSMFNDCSEELRNFLPSDFCNKILGTEQKSHIQKLRKFITNS